MCANYFLIYAMCIIYSEFTTFENLRKLCIIESIVFLFLFLLYFLHIKYVNIYLTRHLISWRSVAGPSECQVHLKLLGW